MPQKRFLLVLCLPLIMMYQCHKGAPNKPDSGGCWTPQNNGLLCLQIRDIAIDINDSKQILVATAQGIYKSSNGSQSWAEKNIGLTKLDITDIEIVPPDGRIILAGSWGGGIFMSDNRGESWMPMNNGLDDPRVFMIRATYEANPSYYAATETGLYKWTSHLGKWEKLLIPGAGGPTTCIAIQKNNSNEIYAGVKYTGIFKSIDGGVSWERKDNGLPWSTEGAFATPTAIHIDPINDQLLIMTAGWSGLYISANAGTSWEKVSALPGGYELKCLAICPSEPENIFIGTTSGVLWSKDDGNSWEVLNDGLTNLDVRALAIDPKDPRIIYAGIMGGGVFKYVRD